MSSNGQEPQQGSSRLRPWRGFCRVDIAGSMGRSASPTSSDPTRTLSSPGTLRFVVGSDGVVCGAPRPARAPPALSGTGPWGRCWRAETTPPHGAGVRLAPPAPSRAAAGRWSTRLWRPCSPSSTSYMRPAPWPHPMHKCAMGPGAASCSQYVVNCAIAVQRRARTQFDKCVHTRPPWSVWPG
jgi:hypothetical protein